MWSEAGVAGASALRVFGPEDLDTSGLDSKQRNRLALIVKMFAEKTLRYALENPNGSWAGSKDSAVRLQNGLLPIACSRARD